MGFLKAKGAVYKPVYEVDLGPDSDEVYLRANVKAPRMAGLLIKVFAWFLELPIFGGILMYILKRNNQFHKLVSFVDLQEPPLFVPLRPHQGIQEKEATYLEHDMPPPERVQQALNCIESPENVPKTQKLGFLRWTIPEFFKAYTSEDSTPLMVAEKFVAAVRESSSPSLNMSFFINFCVEDILKQATESTLRYKRGEPISVLDGVLVAVKDEIDCMPYPTTGGTKWLHKVRQCKDDACCVKRLRLCGAILVGKTNMHELGAGVSGINPHYGPARNPYNRNMITGGSSSGSAAVVAAGLCPVALGVDGGGSVRLPAALCGVVGLKPTFSRVPHEGVLPLNYTVGMVGILAASVEDALIVYAAISGNLTSDQNGVIAVPDQPKLPLPLLKSADYTSYDIKMARYGKWFDDCSDDIKVCCSNAVTRLSDKYGWKIVDVTIPELEVMRLAHYVTIGSECSSSMSRYSQNLSKAEMGWDVRFGLSAYGSFDSQEYLNAQRIRNRQLQFHEKIFSMADIIVTPTVGVTAYDIKDDATRTGELDYINGAALVRYQVAGNFLGLPAVTVPVGYDQSSLPIGLQFIGKPWSESLLIHVAYAIQALCLSEQKKPEIFYDMLYKD
ncbi:fatty acid amide hydrolase-like isoform X1 [Primulina tabacum]|uniref:fatty acid amide hydrolase-like isoform X1 n=1 Tax=Primulina tabacum TaxID=48773 RepID=UPI003F5A7D68